MRLLLNDNIREYRKGMKLTQEQLAEAMGVSVGTVSKWESGVSSPNIELIVELAEFFQISVDVLLGYGWEKRNMGECAARLKYLREQHQFVQGITDAGKFLKKYPNSFLVVYESAMMYYYEALSYANNLNGGVSDEIKEKMKTALQLFIQSLDLMEQNTDRGLSEIMIHQNIGSLYGYLGEKETAIEYLKEHNVCGINDLKIGMFWNDMGKFRNAEYYIIKELKKNMLGLWNGYVSMFQVLINTKRFQEALNVSDWIRKLFLSAASQGHRYLYLIISQIDGYVATVYAYMAECDNINKKSEIRDNLRLSLQETGIFDENPDYAGIYDFFGSEFPTVCDLMGDSFGSTAAEAVKNVIYCSKEDEKPYEILVTEYNKLILELKMDKALIIGGSE